jgi:hypothetical protein
MTGFKSRVEKAYSIETTAVSDDELRKTIQMMKQMGLVPRGTGKPTLPSRMPSFNVISDVKGRFYLLVTDLGGKGDVWRITPNGDSEYVSGYTGTWKKQQGQVRYTDANYHDHVELAVIQEICGLLDPEFDGDDDPKHKTIH